MVVLKCLELVNCEKLILGSGHRILTERIEVGGEIHERVA